MRLAQRGIRAVLITAALPPSTHLSILLNLVSAHPELKGELMDKLPQPDLHECLAQLDKLVDKVKRGVGSSAIQLNQDRVWTRVQKDVDTYCRSVSDKFLKHRSEVC